MTLTTPCLQYQKWCPYKLKGVVSTPVCASMVGVSADQGHSTASRLPCARLVNLNRHAQIIIAGVEPWWNTSDARAFPPVKIEARYSVPALLTPH